MKFRAYMLVAALLVSTVVIAQQAPTQSAPAPQAPSAQAPSQAGTPDPQQPAAQQTPTPPTFPPTDDKKPADSKKPSTTVADEPVPQVANPPKETHDGGKNDIDAIGNRKIGNGKGLGNWYSLEKEIAMGKEYAAQIESTVKLVQDPVVNEYVNRIGQNLVRNSDAKVPFTIKVIDSDEVNAFALPGGF